MFAGTIVASNYAEMAQVLGESFLRHHPSSRFAILVIDDGVIEGVGDGIEILRLGDIDLSERELDLMKTIYDVMEFSTAVKPSLLRTLLRSDEVACYLDPDIFVYSPFDDAIAMVAQHGIVLTPHVLEPIPRDGLAVSERAIRHSGIFNLGFIAVGSTAGSFLDWWAERLLTDAVVDLDDHLFTDQKWVDWVPALFPHHISRDPGLNIAWWNIHERELARGDSGPVVNGVPVRFVHFSGYDPSRSEVLSKHPDAALRIDFEPGSVIRELADAYGDRLVARGHTERRSGAYQWAATSTGLRLTSGVRHLCRSAVVAELRDGASLDESRVPSAFGPDSEQLRDWLCEPDGGTDRHPLTRLERAVWASRRDLREVFPDIDGSSAEGFRLWLSVEDDAVDELGDLAPPRVPRPAAAAPSPLRSLASATARIGRRVANRVRSRG
jgi:hypothetical protein